MSDRSSSSLVTERIAQDLAKRTGRRTFLGYLGRFALIAAGSPAFLSLTAREALALQCDCSGRNCDQGCGGPRSLSCQHNGHSVTCKGLTGSGCPATGGTGGVCPNNTHACGSWTCTNCGVPGCPNNTRTWVDCCADTSSSLCDSSSSAQCICDVDGVTRATCKYRHCYANGGGTGCNFIRCRWANC
jgi:hypothetical protein